MIEEEGRERREGKQTRRGAKDREAKRTKSQEGAWPKCPGYIGKLGEGKGGEGAGEV